MGGHLRFERLVLLDLRLQVDRVLVVLVGRRLQLLQDPRLELVAIALEVLEAPGVLQQAALLVRLLLELVVLAEHLLAPVADVLDRLQHLHVGQRRLRLVAGHLRAAGQANPGADSVDASRSNLVLSPRPDLGQLDLLHRRLDLKKRMYTISFSDSFSLVNTG